MLVSSSNQRRETPKGAIPMMNRTELDVRFQNHAARVSYADRFGALCDEPAARRPRRLTELLQSVARRAPRQTRIGRQRAAYP
jgi:hypothetical protein